MEKEWFGESEVVKKEFQISQAPMLKFTTPPMRYLIRLLSKKVVLFTEMFVSETIEYLYKNDREKLERKIGVPEGNTVVQIGGSNIESIIAAVIILKSMGWCLFNLNCGCPSDRVQNGRFGAVLMQYPDHIVEIINSIYEKTNIIISLKIRTGVDNDDSYEFFHELIEKIYEKTLCREFYVHARKCWLNGLSPSQNRKIPPINREHVYRLKAHYQDKIKIHLNGEISDNGIELLNNLDGIMIGRYSIKDITVFNRYTKEPYVIQDIVQKYLSLSEISIYKRRDILQPLENLCNGYPNKKKYKNMLENIVKEKKSLEEACSLITSFLSINVNMEVDLGDTSVFLKDSKQCGV